MGILADFADIWRLDIGVGDLTGAIGDSVTVLPLVVALGLLTAASLPHVLIGFAVFQIIWGIQYGVPLSVEPMKALAGLAIAGTITYNELIGAGLLAGCVLLVAGRRHWLVTLSSVVGAPVVRGIQFAVACLLVVAALELVMDEPLVASFGAILAVIVALISRRAVALVLLGFGSLWAIAMAGVPEMTIPALIAFPSGVPTITVGAVEGMFAQLAMTVGNAAIATSLLLSDLYDTDVSPDRLAESMGVMNLTAIPFGALPMCHGSGGLAGKYAFGAQTAVANLVAGLFYVGVALFAGLLLVFPMALLGILLLIVAASLANVAFSSTDRPLFVATVGGVAVLTNIGFAFVAAIIWWNLWRE